jgi:hypothetical protein
MKLYSIRLVVALGMARRRAHDFGTVKCIVGGKELGYGNISELLLDSSTRRVDLRCYGCGIPRSLIRASQNAANQEMLAFRRPNLSTLMSRVMS